MKSNKKIAMILSFTLVVSSTPLAFAKDNALNNNIIAVNTTEIKYLSKEKAIGIAKKALKDYHNISVDEKQFTLEANQYIPDKNNTFNDMSLWNIIYTSKNNDETISVSMDLCTGDIYSLYIPYNTREKNKKPTITQLEAEKMSKDFFAKIAPDKSNEFKVTSSNDYDGITSFNFSRTVDGVDFGFDYAFIEIDTVNKKLLNFNYRYTKNLNFIKQESTLINKDAAKKIFNDNIKMNLIYIQDNKINNKYIPVYSSYFTQSYNINANKGVFFNKETEATTYNINKEDLSKITKKYNTKIEHKKLTTAADAKALAIKLTKDILGKDLSVAKIDNTKPSSESTINNVNAWNIELKNNNDTTVYLSLNADNSSILNLYESHESSTNDKFTPIIPWKQAYTKALETIVNYSPEKLIHINTSHIINEISKKDLNTEYMETDYYFNFTRNENGIDSTSDCIYLSIDARTGSITSFGCNWNDSASFVEPKNLIGEEKAKKIFMDNTDAKLKYILEGSTNIVNLSYILDFNNPNSQLIDGISGKFIEPISQP